MLKRKFFLGVLGLGVLLSACGGPAKPAEETTDLQLNIDSELPANLSRAYLVVHHQDGRPDRWFDLKQQSGEQPLPGVAKHGWLTVLVEWEGDYSGPHPGPYKMRSAVSWPTDVFLSYDKGIGIDENGWIRLVFSGVENPWRNFTLAGACPDGAELVTNADSASAPLQTGAASCSAGTLEPYAFPAQIQSDGSLSSVFWAARADGGRYTSLDPPAYAVVTDVAPGATFALNAADWRTDAADWRVDVSGAPADAVLITAFAAFRKGAAVTGFNAFSAACPDPDLLCRLSLVPAADGTYDGYELEAVVYGNGIDFVSQLWRPLAQAAASHELAWGQDFYPPYTDVSWPAGDELTVQASGGTDAVRSVGDVWSYDLAASPYLRREWVVFGRDGARTIDYPQLPSALAEFAPDADDDQTGAAFTGFDYDPLTVARPAAGRIWTLWRSIRSAGSLQARPPATPALRFGATRWTGSGKANVTVR